MLACYYGTDAFRLRQAVIDLIGSKRTERDSALNVVRIDCTHAGADEELERHLKYPSFFGDRKLIVAVNAAGPLMADILERYEPTSLDDIILVAVQDTSQKGFDAKILAKLTRHADLSAEFTPLSGALLNDWIRAFCEERHTVLEPAAARELLSRTGEHTGLLAVELEKLSAYARGSMITADMVRTLTPARPERDEWELSNAIAAHDKRAIVAALWRKVQEGTPDQLLVGSLAAGLRNLLIIKELTSQRIAPAGIAKLTGLHPFVVSKTLRGAGNADTIRLRQAHLSLTKLDRDAKDGIADAVDGMFALLLAL